MTDDRYGSDPGSGAAPDSGSTDPAQPSAPGTHHGQHTGHHQATPDEQGASQAQNPYASGQYGASGFGSSGHYADSSYDARQTASGPYGPNQYSGSQYGGDQYGTGTGQYTSSQYGSGQYGSSQYGYGAGYGHYGSDQLGQSYSGHPTGTQPIGGPPGPSGPAYHPAADQPRRGGMRAGVVVGVVALCALAGGIGGLVGAGIDDQSTTSVASGPLAGDRDTAQPASAPAGSTQAVAAKVLPSVVSIDVRVGNREGEGSGVVLSQDGYILTNNHVVTAESGRPGSLTVSYSDGSTSGASVVGTDPISDIAVLKADKAGLTPITVGTSSNLAVGQSVIAVGSPLGLAGTVTTGIISSLNRPVSTQGEGSGTASVIDAIQTDAAINPGNSGGALVNANGALIGVNTAIASLSDSSQQQGGSIGLGFAIPIDQAMRVAQELQRTGRATQAGLGVTVQSAGENAQSPGAVISGVQPGGAAAKAGIPAGAVVSKVNDRVISSGDALVAAIRSHAPGDTVQITYSQGGSSRTVQVTLDTLDTGGR